MCCPELVSRQAAAYYDLTAYFSEEAMSTNRGMPVDAETKNIVETEAEIDDLVEVGTVSGTQGGVVGSVADTSGSGYRIG